MKKNSILLRVGVAAMVLTLATTSLMSGTLAKYTSNIEGVGKALVAKWDPQLKINNAGPESQTSKVNFTLADTANSNVKDGVIAPGTKGSVPILISLNGSEVNCGYKVYLKRAGTAPINVQGAGVKFYLSSSANYTNSDLIDFNSESYNPDTAVKDGTLMMGSSEQITYNLFWDWPYSDGSSQDSLDTQVGEDVASAMAEEASKADGGKPDEARTIEYTVTVELTQLDRPATPGP